MLYYMYLYSVKIKTIAYNYDKITEIFCIADDFCKVFEKSASDFS